MATTYKIFPVSPQGGGVSNFPWLDTGINVTVNQALKITAFGTVHLYRPVDEDAMPWVGPDGCDDNGDCSLGAEENLLIPYAPGAKLLGRVGISGPPFEVGTSFETDSLSETYFEDHILLPTERLYLTINDYVLLEDLEDEDPELYVNEWYTDNRGGFIATIITDAPAEAPHDGGGETGGGCAAAGTAFSANPIELHHGDKRVFNTDLIVQTPAGPMALERHYRQSRNGIGVFNTSYGDMGLGWSHNHDVRLILDGTAPDRDAEVLFGWQNLKLAEDTGSQGHFDALAGSSAVLDHDSGNNEYVLMMEDRQTYVFDDTSPYPLKRRTWPTGEVWSYDYYEAPHIADGLLKEVADGYGRKLQFTYIDNSGSHDHRQLWRVGDQDATGLETASSAAGRYVEYGYNEEHRNGAPVTWLGDALLASVRDVRNQTWTYRYFGQELGETDSNRFNFLTKRLSPSVDTDWDDEADGPITLEALSYGVNSGIISTINQERGDGLLTTDFTFQPSGENITTEVVAGRTNIHEFANGVYLGVRNPAGDIAASVVNEDYRTVAQIDGNGHETALTWGSNGKLLTQVTTPPPLNQTTSFNYDNEDRLSSSLDADNRKTTYLYNGDQRQPAMVLVADDSSVITGPNGDINGDMEQDSGWADVGTPTNQRSSTVVDTGTYARYVSGAVSEGIESDDWTMQANHTYAIMARVYPVNIDDQVRMKVNGMTEFDTLTDDESYGEWQTLRAVHTPTTGGTKKLQFLIESSTAAFYVDSVHVVEVTNLLQWQEFIYDSQGRVLAEATISPMAATIQQQTLRTYGSSGNSNGLLESVTQIDQQDAGNNASTTYTYDGAGRVFKTQQSSLFGSCKVAYTVYDDAGNVEKSICNYTETTPVSDPAGWVWSTTNLRWEFSETDTTPVPLGATQEQNIITATIFDALGRPVLVRNANGQATLTLYDALDRVIRTIANFVDDNYAAPADWVFEGGIWKDGANGTPIAHGTDNTQNIISRTEYNERGLVRLTQNVEGNVTLYGYDDADRLVKTVQNASQSGYNNQYTGVDPDPDLSDYAAIIVNDQDVITTQRYDRAGNVIETIDPLGHVTFTVYDALNRPIKTIRNAKDSAVIDFNTSDDAGYDPTNDPRTDDYEPSLDPDRDLIATTEYDALGRVIRTQHLLENRGASAVWEATLYGYDTLSRQVKVIRSAGQPTYDLAADPDLSAYTASTAADEDLISETVYDENGRTLYTADVLDTRTWLAYDGLGRQIQTIASAVGTATDGGVNDPRSSSYVPSTAADEDLITRTVYNSDGQVQETIDVLGQVTRFVYDAGGRQARTIQNYTAQGATDPADWVWSGGNQRWEYGAADTTAIDHGADNDQNLISETVYDSQGRVGSTFDHRHNETRHEYDALGRRVATIQNYGDGTFSAATPDEDRISTTEYDVAGRVVATVDNAGVETRFVYDALGRRVQTIQNYGDGVFDPADPAVDVIATTVYNQAGQVIATSDARGTQTDFTYDAAGRRLTTTLAVGTYLETTHYTCYNKAGQVLRTIQNWTPGPGDPSPDELVGGVWQFAPTVHGNHNDENLITAYNYDGAGRRTQVTDPAGNVTQTTYFVDGQVNTITDPEAVDTVYRYDQVRRRTLVVQNWVDNGEDPAAWVWDTTQWEESDGTAIAHGADNDQNIIVQVNYDQAGRMDNLRDPRGNLTQYAYDKLGRRTQLTNPLNQDWDTAYADLVGGGTRTTQTMPGINGGAAYNVQRDFDRLGRLSSIQYGDPSNTPDVAFSYDAAGNRTAMTESDGINTIRSTTYGYDDLRRLSSAQFVAYNGLVVVSDETVSYEYDAAGQRTRLTLPGGSDSIQYLYDERGQLVQLTDWDGQITDFLYDDVGRHRATKRPNDLVSVYRYDPAGRLARLRHSNRGRTRADFQYAVDGRGNRTQAVEVLALPTTLGTVYSNPASTVGTWSSVGGFQESTDTHARLSITFPNSTDEIVLTYGVGPDHSIFDVYINGTLWESLDGYAVSAGERTVNIPLRTRASGSHELAFRNRTEQNAASSGTKLRFKQLQVLTTTYTNQSIQYTYDGLSRLQQADYDSGDRVYDFNYDRAGNRLAELLSGTGVTATNRYFGYNAANQLIAEGDTLDGNGAVVADYTYAYDANGNLLNKQDITPTTLETYTWDRANRLLTAPGSTSYQYDGLGNRIQQTVSSVVTDYLLDTQPGLTVVMQQTTSGNTDRFVHGPRGIHAQQDNSGDWFYPVPDGLGSVRGVADSVLAVQGMQHYVPYGTPFGQQGSLGMPFGFTGEPTDANDLVYLRARYLSPGLGVFASLDPFEGMAGRPMSLNGYMYVEGNTPNMVDPSGWIPTEGDIRKGRIRYSCNCGWIDISHVAEGLRLAPVLQTALTTPINYASLNAVEGVRIIRVPDHNLGPSIPFFVRFSALVPDSAVSSSGVPVGMGIFMEFEEAFEELQSIANPILDIAGRASGFAEEDLPSDLMGYWLWLSYRNASMIDPERFAALDRLCCVMSEGESLFMYNQYTSFGLEHAFSTNWRNWYRRPRPSHVNCPDGADCQMCGSERWPDYFDQLARTALRKSGQISVSRMIANQGSQNPLTIPANGWYEISDVGDVSLINGVRKVEGVDALYVLDKNSVGC